MKSGMRMVRWCSSERCGRWRSRRISIALGLGLSILLAASSLDAAVLEFLEFYRNGVGGVSGLNGVRGVRVSPDGAHVYVASASDNSVVVFARDEETGLLTFVEAERDGVAGVDGLDGAYLATLSPDGAHVYVAASNDDAVAVFERDGATGALSFVELQRDGDPGVDGLDGSTSVVVSPDGAHVYVAGALDDAVAVFNRNNLTGALSFVEFHKDGQGGVDGLNGITGLTVSPDNADVYGASFFDSSVSVFDRDAATGALTFAEFQQDGVGGVDGLEGVNSVGRQPRRESPLRGRVRGRGGSVRGSGTDGWHAAASRSRRHRSACGPLCCYRVLTCPGKTDPLRMLEFGRVQL